MGMNCPPLLVNLFLHAYEADFRQGFLKNNGRKLAQTFNSSFHSIEDLLSLNNIWFGNYVHRLYPNDLAAKDTTDTQKYASYLDQTKLYDRCDDLTFPIVNFSFISSNIPALPT